MTQMMTIGAIVAALFAMSLFLILKLYNEIDSLRDGLSKATMVLKTQQDAVDRTMRVLNDITGEMAEKDEALAELCASLDKRVSEIESIHLDSVKEQAKQEKLFSDGLENILNFYSTSGGEKSK